MDTRALEAYRRHIAKNPPSARAIQNRRHVSAQAAKTQVFLSRLLRVPIESHVVELAKKARF